MLHDVLWNLWKRVSEMRAKHKRLDDNIPSTWHVPDDITITSRLGEYVEPDEPVTDSKHFATGGRVQPKRVITLKESDYAQLQSLVLKYGSGTGHGTSLSIDARVAIADAAYDWSKGEDTSRKED